MPNLNILRGAPARDFVKERVEGVDIIAGAGRKGGVVAEEGSGEGGPRDGELGHVGDSGVGLCEEIVGLRLRFIECVTASLLVSQIDSRHVWGGMGIENGSRAQRRLGVRAKSRYGKISDK